MTEKEECKTLCKFLDWCYCNEIKINSKVKITSLSTSHRYGVIALEDIKSNATLIEIPRKMTLTPPSSSIAEKIKIFQELYKEKLKETSGWIPLLITLMHEVKIDESFWAPYLSLCPKIEEFNQPMFWSEEERQEKLAGVSLLWDVQRDLFNIAKEYKEFVLPFIEANTDVMSSETHILDLYKQMVGFVMSYSFTDGEHDETLMVPVADIFNHHSNNNALLSFEDDGILKMVSTKPIRKGEEIFNTFGKLGNSHLLHMYGFVEKSYNMYDTVDMPLVSVVDILEATDVEKTPVLQAMLAYMRKMGIADEKDYFVFCAGGLKSGPDMYAVLRILHMEMKEFIGLLQDHVNWYQDSYFVYLLEHVHEATKKELSEDETQNADDSDDDVVFVKEVKGNSKHLNSIKAKKDGNCTTRVAEQDGSKVHAGAVDENKNSGENSEASQSNDKNTADVNSTQTESICELNEKVVGGGKHAEIATSGLAPKRKQLPLSDGHKKNKTRKRKLLQPIVDLEDSEEDVVLEKSNVSWKQLKQKIRKHKEEKANGPGSEHCRETNVVVDKKGIVEPSGDTELSDEETDGNLLLISSKEEDHSEDPDDGSDDEDSETHLQLTYDQINSILPPSWKITMRSVVADALAVMKSDDSPDEPNMTEHGQLAHCVRSGQLKILKLLEKSLAS